MKKGRGWRGRDGRGRGMEGSWEVSGKKDEEKRSGLREVDGKKGTDGGGKWK